VSFEAVNLIALQAEAETNNVLLYKKTKKKKKRKNCLEVTIVNVTSLFI